MSLRILSFVSFVAACGGSVSSGGNGGGGSAGGGGSGGVGGAAGGSGGSGPTPAEACAAAAPAFCQKLSDCSNGAVVTFRYGDLATCEARTIEGCLAAFAAPETAGDPAETLACSQSIGATACADIFEEALVGPCAPHAGGRALGEPCVVPAQCASAYCATPDGAPCGTCAAPPVVGDDCSAVTDCGYGLTCAQVSTCSAFAQDGDPCGPDAACGWSLSCVGNPGTCMPAGTMIGDACDLQAQTAADCNRALGLFCSPLTNTCVAAAAAQAGMACGNVMGTPTGCAAMGTCDSGTCVAAAADGAPCDAVMGPKCLPPADCVVPVGQTQSVCAIADGATCG